MAASVLMFFEIVVHKSQRLFNTAGGWNPFVLCVQASVTTEHWTRKLVSVDGDGGRFRGMRESFGLLKYYALSRPHFPV